MVISFYWAGSLAQFLKSNIKSNNMETIKNKKPSYFTNYPWSSIFHNTEHEIIAVNIMKILNRTGDEFRSIDWEEYKTERLKDGNFSDKEKIYFEKVISYCVSAEKAKTFSTHWSN